jgi:hypothetical protein
MKLDINLLIIEDEQEQIQMYQDVINSFNKQNETYIIKEVICKTFEEGKSALYSPNYDAAIIDLKLSNSVELEGRSLVEAIYQKIKIPVFVYSGSISQINDIIENFLFRKYSRTSDLKIILKEIETIFSTGITSFIRQNGLIDETLTKIFWKHLSKDLNIWIQHNNPKTLLRYILSLFQEYLDIDIEGNFEDYHPQEIYLEPPVKVNLHTGDIVEIGDKLFLLVTPSCDMVLYKNKNGSSRKAEKILLASISKFEVNLLCINNKGEIDKGKISNYVKNHSYRYHYLPPFKENDGFLVDFQNLKSISEDEITGRVATISSSFIKDIISRFSNYYSRQGQPTFNQDELIDSIYRNNFTSLKKN